MEKIKVAYLFLGHEVYPNRCQWRHSGQQYLPVPVCLCVDERASARGPAAFCRSEYQLETANGIPSSSIDPV